MDTQQTLSDILRRLANLIALGTVHSVDGATCRVAIGGNAEQLTPPIKWITGRAASQSNWSQLDVGEQVLLLSPSGDYGNAVAIAGLYSNANPPPSINPAETVVEMPDGAVFAYNHEIHQLSITLPDGASTNIASTGGVSIIGDLGVIGSINASGNVSDAVRSMADDRAIYNIHDHVLPGVGTTNPTLGQQ